MPPRNPNEPRYIIRRYYRLLARRDIYALIAMFDEHALIFDCGRYAPVDVTSYFRQMFEQSPRQIFRNIKLSTLMSVHSEIVVTSEWYGDARITPPAYGVTIFTFSQMNQRINMIKSYRSIAR